MTLSNEPVVLVGGHLCDERLWTHQTRDLTQNGVPVHVVVPGPHASVAALADEAEQRLPSGTFALAGFSLGGMIALELLARMPDRVTRLALIDTTGRAAPPAEHALVLKNIAKAEAGGPQAVVEKFITFLHAPGVELELIAETRAMMLSRAETCYIPQQIAMRDRLDRRAMLAGITCPTLVLCGGLDLVTPPALHEEIATLVPGAELKIIPDAGHMITSERPGMVSAALRGWLGVASAGT